MPNTFLLLLFLFSLFPAPKKEKHGRGRAPSAAPAPSGTQPRSFAVSSRRLGLPRPRVQEHQPVLLVGAGHRPLRRAFDPRGGVVRV